MKILTDLKYKRNRKFVFIVWLIIILALSVMPVPEVNAPDNFDKLVHFGLYFFTSVMYYLLIHRKQIVSVIFSTSYGFFIEVVQIFVPYRSFSLWDGFFNFLGALVSLLLLYKSGRSV
jgi:VanZ family protein